MSHFLLAPNTLQHWFFQRGPWSQYLNLSATDKQYQIIPVENPHQKTDSLLKRSRAMMAKLIVCVSILSLLVALSESSKYDFTTQSPYISPIWELLPGLHCSCIKVAFDVNMFMMSPLERSLLLHTVPSKASPSESAEILHNPGGHRLLQHQGSNVRTLNEYTCEKKKKKIHYWTRTNRNVGFAIVVPF